MIIIKYNIKYRFTNFIFGLDVGVCFYEYFHNFQLIVEVKGSAEKRSAFILNQKKKRKRKKKEKQNEKKNKNEKEEGERKRQ